MQKDVVGHITLMKRNVTWPYFGMALLTTLTLICCGCQDFRSGERSSEEVDQLNAAKMAESHYWPAYKPDRSLEDPLWTP